MARDGGASTGAQVLSQAGRQAENGAEVLPAGDVQAARAGGEASRVRGMAGGGDAAVRGALAADLLELAGGLGRGPLDAPLGDGELLDALRGRFSCRVVAAAAAAVGGVGGRLGPNGRSAANAAV